MVEWLVPRVAEGVELLAIAVLLGGLLWAFVRAASGALRGGGVFRGLRQSVGRAILLTLELLVAADIVRTLLVGATLEHLVVLGGIVLIRTFLSFSLEVEIEGRWPWQQAAGEDFRPPPANKSISTR